MVKDIFLHFNESNAYSLFERVNVHNLRGIRKVMGWIA